MGYIGKMSKETFNLTWDTFDHHVKEMMSEMLKDDGMADVTLVSDDMKQFRVHKIILSSCSSVFKSLLSPNNHESIVVYLNGILFEELEAIIQFMYLGKTSLKDERIDCFFDATKSLNVKELNNYIESNEIERNPTESMKLDERNNDIDDKSHILKEVDQKSLINQGKVEVNNGYM